MMSQATNRKAKININFSEFEMPPMQDVLLVGKKAPIGAEAVRRMADVLAPDQYEVVKVKHDIIEAVVMRKALVSVISKERFLAIILEEGGKVANEATVIKAEFDVDISLQISKSIDL